MPKAISAVFVFATLFLLVLVALADESGCQGDSCAAPSSRSLLQAQVKARVSESEFQLPEVTKYNDDESMYDFDDDDPCECSQECKDECFRPCKEDMTSPECHGCVQKTSCMECFECYAERTESEPRGACDPANFCEAGTFHGDIEVWPGRTCDHVLKNEGGWVCNPNPSSEQEGGQRFARQHCCSAAGSRGPPPPPTCDSKTFCKTGTYNGEIEVWPGRTCDRVLNNEGGWVCNPNPSSEQEGGQRYAQFKCCA
eukprot:TRINITY_DN5873_c0_g1_i1.p1 TRINITY_DN5873_c0_g1~~TRINITY_DN5873_c0_g1_i1.p1  ORF type:complete len:255 (-),score=38.13 TRINITY_DN5873_c0_g1_i1:99-863(-)